MEVLQTLFVGGSRILVYTPEIRYEDGMTKTFSLSGHIRNDHFGRLVVDQCESDNEHLRAPGDGGERQTCRNLVEDAFLPFVGKCGRLTITVTLLEE